MRKSGEPILLKHMLSFEQPTPASPCTQTFPVFSKQYTRLKDDPFNGQLYVYFGDQRLTPKGRTADLTAFLSAAPDWHDSGTLSQSEFNAKGKTLHANEKWSLKVPSPGDSIGFRYEGKPFQLKVIGPTPIRSKAKE